jgi:hypothetical protein
VVAVHQCCMKSKYDIIIEITRLVNITITKIVLGKGIVLTAIYEGASVA